MELTLHVKVNVDYEDLNDATNDKTRQVTSLDLVSSDESVKPVLDGMIAVADDMVQAILDDGSSLSNLPCPPIRFDT